MKYVCLSLALALCVSCSSDPEPSEHDMDHTHQHDAGADAAVAVDTGGDPDVAVADVGGGGTDAGGFCASADCAGDTPVCSEILGACVECASNSDCATAPLLTCDTVAGDDDPTFTCVECVDDTVCGGGTCDQATNTCVP